MSFSFGCTFSDACEDLSRNWFSVVFFTSLHFLTMRGPPSPTQRTKQCIATKVAVESAPQSHKVHLTFHQFWFTPQFLKLVASDINIIQYIDRLDRRACSGKDSVQKYARLQKHFLEPAVFCSRCIPFSKPCPFLSLGKHPLNFAPTCFA